MQTSAFLKGRNILSNICKDIWTAARWRHICLRIRPKLEFF